MQPQALLDDLSLVPADERRFDAQCAARAFFYRPVHRIHEFLAAIGVGVSGCIIMKDLIRLMDPKYIEVWGKFTPRGGISIDPYCNYGKPGTRWEQVAFDRLAHHDLYPEKVDNR